jgi:hypothetical protein
MQPSFHLLVVRALRVLWAATGLVLILQTSEAKTMGKSPKILRSITTVPFTVYTYPSYPRSMYDRRNPNDK